MTRSAASGWISARVEQAFELDGVDWSDLQGIGLEAFGLRPSPCGNCDMWLYQSRPYRLLGYELQPELRCNVQRSASGLRLKIIDIFLNGRSKKQDWLTVDSSIFLSPGLIGTQVQQCFELTLARRGPLALLPRSGVPVVLDRALAETNSRICRALRRRLENALSVKS